MAKFTAVLESAEDGTWSAYTLAPSLVIGSGNSRDAALDDLRLAMTLWLDHMKQTGQPIPPTSSELVSFEVAA